jgi:hypothetical protein
MNLRSTHLLRRRLPLTGDLPLRVIDARKIALLHEVPPTILCRCGSDGSIRIDRPDRE